MAMLVRSDNAASETLAADYPGGRREFVSAMNRQARQLELRTMQFDDPSGLSSKNTSTAGDVANMVQIASGYWVIREASTRKDVEFETLYQKKVRKIKLNHTSGDLLFAFDSVIVSKTGLTNSAGWCVGMMVEQNQKQYVIVVLGSRTKQQRTSTAQDLLYNHIVDKNLQDPWKMQ
jgi:D-alanyl-D-alanine endopeptidase (penicillin-binding protein 7)